MNCAEESPKSAFEPSSSTFGDNSLTKTLVQEVLEANKRLQKILVRRAEQLEAKLKEADQLLASATIEESQDDPESEISIPGAKKTAGLFASADFLNPASPFYEEATKRFSYISNINPHSLKPKDIEILSAAVRQENERIQAYKTELLHDHNNASNGTIDFQNNVDGLDWNRIAEKVSDASSVKRTAADCRIAWVADKHPSMNHTEWSEDELNALNALISQYTKDKKPVNWVIIAEKLGTHRTPIACMRHALPRHRHHWTPEADQKLLQAVESCGHDNWQLVARKVSEHVSAVQCQNRWQKTLNPTLRKGAWTEEEDERLRKSFAGFGPSWIQVASAIPGRTNDQCRERWMEHVNNVSSKAVWTPSEDKILMELVKKCGNQWKVISLKIGNGKTGQTCRLRHEKLKRSEKSSRHTSTSLSAVNVSIGLSHSVDHNDRPLQDTPIMAPSVNMHEFHSHLDVEPALPIVNPRPKPRPKAKGKAKGEGKEIAPPLDDEPSASGPSQVEEEQLNTMYIAEGLASVDKAPETIPVASGSTLPKDTRKPISKPRPRPWVKGPSKGKVSDVVQETNTSEKHIDLTVADTSDETGQAELAHNPRPNEAAKPSPRSKRKATDAPDSMEFPKSKRTKMSKKAEPKISLPTTNLVGPGIPNDNDRHTEVQQHSGLKKLGRPRRKNTPTAAGTETKQIKEATPDVATTKGDTSVRTRRQSSRLSASARPPS